MTLSLTDTFLNSVILFALQHSRRPCSGIAGIRALIAGCVFSSAIQVFAGSAVEAWTRRYSESPNTYNQATALAMGPAGEIYVTGGSDGQNGYIDYATLAYSKDGTALWTNRYDGPGLAYDLATAIAVDGSSGNVYVTGWSFSASGYEDTATIAYSSNGLSLWTNRFSVAYGNCVPECIAVGPQGTVFVGGAAGAYYGQYLVLAYSGSGKLLWTNLYSPGPTLSAFIHAGMVGPEGNFYVTGSSDSTPHLADYLTIAYSKSGVALWTNRYNGPGNGIDNAFAMAVDSASGSVYVTGVSTGAGTGRDIATLAYSSTGVSLWTNRWNAGGSTDDQAAAIAVAPNGNVHVVGVTAGSEAGPAVTLCYSASGTALWTNYYRDAVDPYGGGDAVAVGADGTVVVAGHTLSAGSVRKDIVTLGYSSTGIGLWTNRYDGPAHRYDQVSGPACIGISTDGAVYVAGTSQTTNGTQNVYDYALIKYVLAPDIRMSEVALFPDMSYRLTLNAPTNVAYRLEGSSGLTGPWQVLTNIPPLPFTSLQYTDTLAPLFPTRFYRTVWSP